MSRLVHSSMFVAPHRIWESNLLGSIVRIERYGPCDWDKILFLKNKEEVYRIEKTNRTRKEYFSGEFFRKYVGDKICFVEYCEAIEKEKRLPSSEEFINSGLEANLEKEYRKFFEKIIEKN